MGDVVDATHLEASRAGSGPLMTNQPLANPPVLYTAAEAAGILRVKKSWLERQAAARKIPFTMLGHSYRFTPAHLAVIVQLYERGPAPGNGHPLITTHRNSTHSPIATAAAESSLRPRPRQRPPRRTSARPAA
jgi:excisionase family DNA binding protein